MARDDARGTGRPEVDRERGQGRSWRLLATLEGLLAIRATDVKGALDEASQIVAEAMGTEKVDTFLFDPSAATLVAVGTSGTPMGRRQHAIGLDRLAVANGGRYVAVFQTGKPFRNGRTDEDPDELRGVKEGLGVHSTLAAPIEVDGARRGVFTIVSARPDAFAEDDLAFCEAAARWVGLILHRAELTERIAREAAAQARRAAAEELIDVLAHDLRGPLTPARGYLDLLRRRAVAEGRAQDVRYADQIAQAHERLNDMIEEMLDAGRLEQGLFALSTQPVDVAALVAETAGMLQTPGTTIHVAVGDGRDLVVERADPERLRQAMENLIGNALAHSPSGTPVVVGIGREARAEGEWIVVTVRDEGPGIAPEVLPTLFGRFAPGPRSKGLGLGLYLARGIAEAHGGALTAESAPGAGTTFRLALPVGDPAG